MRIYFLLLFLTGILFHAQAQAQTKAAAAPPTTSAKHRHPSDTSLQLKSQAQTIEDTTVYIANDSINPVDIEPEFPGGEPAFYKFLSARLIYPEDAKKKRIQGPTYIEFIVEKNGSLSNFKAVDGKSLSPSIDQAVINVLVTSPRWKPGYKNGAPVRVKKIARVKFSLN